MQNMKASRPTTLLCAYKISGPEAFLAGPSLKVLKLRVVNKWEDDAVAMIRAWPSGELFAADNRAGKRSLVR